MAGGGSGVNKGAENRKCQTPGGNHSDHFFPESPLWGKQAGSCDLCNDFNQARQACGGYSLLCA